MRATDRTKGAGRRSRNGRGLASPRPRPLAYFYLPWLRALSLALSLALIQSTASRDDDRNAHARPKRRDRGTRPPSPQSSFVSGRRRMASPSGVEATEAAAAAAPEPSNSNNNNNNNNAVQSEQERLLRRGELLALGHHLKEALEAYSAALRLRGPLPPSSRRRLGTLVDCLALHYRLRQKARLHEGETETPLDQDEAPAPPPPPLFRCPGCGGFLGDPVTAPCGHSYCRRCLREQLRLRCRRCGGELLGCAASVTVVLGHLAEKWFPSEEERAKRRRRLGEILREGRPREALEEANKALLEDPNDLMLQVYRAESYAGLQDLKSALDDLNAVTAKMPNWPEAYYRRAKILHNAGSVDDALQLFLHCLALDEGFLPAKLEVEKMLFDLLSPENVQKSLKESTLNSSHVRNKQFIQDSESETEESYDNLQQTSVTDLEVPGVTSESVGGSLHRAQSTHSLNSTRKMAKEDGLKRVSSEPLLSSQEKGALLKRKLSLSEQDFPVCEDGRNKHKKQGESTKRDAAFSFSYETIPEDLVDVSDFECSLCMRLFFHPVTTPCGHTFCRNCLERCLDYAPQCPLCKESLKEYLASRKYSITQLIQELIVKYMPAELSERKRINDEEISEHASLTKNVPVFVCTMAYPTVPCPLHVFEPRYRLMIRRSIETGTKQFGMCVSDPQNGFADYGCMLYIRNLDYLPDGRSVVDTVGLKRFKVLRRGMKDGYCTADIEYLEDVKVEDEGEMKKLGELHDFVYNQACSWFQSLRNKFRSQILQHFGPMPEREVNIQETANGPAWCWWLLAVLPVDPRYQLTVLSMKSLKERLVKIQDILTYFSRDQSK